MKALAIAQNNLQRLFRVRSNIFFVIILPMLLILLLGSVFGGTFGPKVGVYDAAGDQLSTSITGVLESEENIETIAFSSEDELVDAVSRGQVQAAIMFPANFEAGIRAGEASTIRYFGRQDSLAPQLRSTIDASVSQYSLVLRAALFTEQEAGAPLDQATAQAENIARTLPAVGVTVSTVGADVLPDEGGGFAASASSQLLLFIFLTSLTGSVALIETRTLGISRRMLATPTSVRTVLLGETLGRYSIALLQGLIIMAGSALFFGVGWGHPLAAVLVMMVFALVGAGAGMLLGSLFNSEQQVTAAGVLLGLGSAAIGGSMVPLEIFPATLKTIAHVTPHAWGNDAFNTLLEHGGGVADITTELGVLAAFAVLLLFISSWLLHRKIVQG
ncbi:MAG: ABC transporter permease [Dehalococcoidia bacterium]